MTRTLFVLLAGAAALAAATPLCAEDAPDLPLRKAGRWEIKTVMDEGKGPREQTLTMCIGDEMERKTAAASESEHQKSCSVYDVKKKADMTTVDAECEFHGRHVDSHTEMSGDFAKSFKVTIKSTTSGSMQGQSIVVKRTISQDGNYLGEDCKGLKVGEAMGTDGSKIMTQQ
jgi:hypothetical protein